MKAGNEHLVPLEHTAQNRCFGCGPANPAGLHLDFMLADDGTVVCLAEIPDTFEGPQGYLHGGIIATLLDEIMSKAIRSHKVVGMTRHMEVDYKRPVPSRSPIRLEARVLRSEGRKHWAEASIMNPHGTVLAHGSALFIEVRPRHEHVALTGEATPHG